MFKKIAFLATSVLALTTTTQAVAADSLLERINNKGTITVGTELMLHLPITMQAAN